MVGTSEQPKTTHATLDMRALFVAFAGMVTIQAALVIGMSSLIGTVYPTPAPFILVLLLVLMAGVITDRIDARRSLKTALGFVTVAAIVFPAAAPQAPNLQVFLGVVLVAASVLATPKRFVIGSGFVVFAVLCSNLIRGGRGGTDPNPYGSMINLTLGLGAASTVFALLEIQHRQLLQVVRATIDRATRAVEDLDAATRAKGRYLANMSHELRTPMNAILGYTELLHDEVDPEHHETLSRVHTAGRQLLADIDDVLDMARREARGGIDELTEEVAKLAPPSPETPSVIDRAQRIRLQASQRGTVESIGWLVIVLDLLTFVATVIIGATPVHAMVLAVGLVGAGVVVAARAGLPSVAMAVLLAGGTGVLAFASAFYPEATKVETYVYFLVGLLALLADRRSFLLGAAVVAGLMLPAQAIRYLQGWTSLAEFLVASNGVLIACVMVSFMIDLRAQHQALVEDSALRTEQALDQAHRLDRARSHLVNQMSHRLRTPLTTVLGYTELLTEDLPEEFTDDLERIQLAGRHLARIVDDVTDMTALENGVSRFHPVRTDVAGICNSAVEFCRGTIEQRGNRLVVDADVHDQVLWDADLVRQILVNLLSNAGKFTENGTVSLRVAVDGYDVRITVSDTGQGIDDEDQRRLFTAFERAVDTTIEGTGLGLAISRRLAELHGGTIEVNSILGEGSTFILTLPRQVG